MNKVSYTVIMVAAALVSVLPLAAQEKRASSTGGNSPHETTSTVIDGSRVTIVYGRPYSKDPKGDTVRKIWGGIVPYGKVWRTGADEATLLITQQPLVIGEKTIPAGAYTLWTLPNEDGTAKLIINQQIGQWGAGRDFKQIYDEKNDVARVDLQKEAVEKSVDQFTMGIAKNPAGGGTLHMTWETTRYSVPFTVKK